VPVHLDSVTYTTAILIRQDAKGLIDTPEHGGGRTYTRTPDRALPVRRVRSLPQWQPCCTRMARKAMLAVPHGSVQGRRSTDGARDSSAHFQKMFRPPLLVRGRLQVCRTVLCRTRGRIGGEDTGEDLPPGLRHRLG
jgi:hypothetical protein